MIDAAGAASVEHAEAANDFTATGTSFRTGLNSIITGGDISVTTPGAVDLGNSTAGGSVSVSGQSIGFNSINAGTSVSLNASGNTAGAEGDQRRVDRRRRRGRPHRNAHRDYRHRRQRRFAFRERQREALSRSTVPIRTIKS